MYLQRRDRRLDPLGATCADRHRRALGGAGLGDREADAARPAGDHHPFALQSEIHARCPFLHVDGRTVARAPPAVPPYGGGAARDDCARPALRSEEHTSELQSLMRISYAVFCLKKKNTITHKHYMHYNIRE